MNTGSDNTLPWPMEVAVPASDAEAELYVPGSNLVLDLHGDPLRAKLNVFSDGNHHMALERTLQAFVSEEPAVEDVFYATTPPRVIAEALKGDGFRIGNLHLSVKPHIFISPGDVLETLHSEGFIGPHEPVMRSRTLAILVRKGNPENISSPEQLLGAEIRLAISNPVTEKASFSVYAEALCATGELMGQSANDTETYLKSERVAHSQIIHHREIPQILASDQADASLIYYHLALRYTRIFPDLFDLIEFDISELPDSDRFSTSYHISLVGDGGEFGDKFLAFFKSGQAAEIYASQGLQSVG